MATEQHELVTAFEDAWERRDKVAAFRVVSALMTEAEAEANLAAASTAIDSNLAKLDEIKELQAKLDGRHVVPITADETHDKALMARLRAYEDECVDAAAETIRSRGQIVNPMTVGHVCRI